MPDQLKSATDGVVCPRCHGDLVAGPTTDGWRLEKRGALLHDSGSAATGPDSADGKGFVCTRCRLPLVIKTSGSQRSIAYPYKRLLADKDWRHFLLWSLAQNNGLVSYVHLEDTSCSVDGREDVVAFASYLARSAPGPGGCILDLGCGPLERAGYLKGFDSERYHMIGVDPFTSSWNGTFVQGVGEYLPLPTGTVDLVTAATSLDHTFDLEVAAAEIVRILRKGGALSIWDHTLPRGRARFDAVQTRVLEWRTRRIHGRHVRVYTDGTVIETPPGMADPFHTKPSRRRSWPKLLDRALRAAGLTLRDTDPRTGFSTYIR